jgi:hypothetical protein
VARVVATGRETLLVVAQKLHKLVDGGELEPDMAAVILKRKRELDTRESSSSSSLSSSLRKEELRSSAKEAAPISSPPPVPPVSPTRPPPPLPQHRDSHARSTGKSRRDERGSKPTLPPSLRGAERSQPRPSLPRPRPVQLPTAHRQSSSAQPPLQQPSAPHPHRAPPRIPVALRDAVARPPVPPPRPPAPR